MPVRATLGGMDPYAFLDELPLEVLLVAALVVTALWLWAYATVAARAGYSRWWCLALVLPVVSLVVMILFVVRTWPVQRRVEQLELRVMELQMQGRRARSGGGPGPGAHGAPGLPGAAGPGAPFAGGYGVPPGRAAPVAGPYAGGYQRAPAAGAVHGAPPPLAPPPLVPGPYAAPPAPEPSAAPPAPDPRAVPPAHPGTDPSVAPPADRTRTRPAPAWPGQRRRGPGPT